MGDTGLKLNKRRSRNGFTIVEVLVTVALLGLFVSALNFFTLSTFASIKMMRIESFVRLFNVNIDQLLNSRAACINTFGPMSPLTNGANITALRNAANVTVLTNATAGLNNNTVDIVGATIENVQNLFPNTRFNIQITYQYNTFSPAQQMVKTIPMVGTIDGGGGLTSCESARGFTPNDLFIRSDIDDTKIGAFTINGNLTFNFGGFGGEALNKLVVVPQAAAPGPNGVFIPSDRSLKKDIVPIDIGKSDFNQLHSYRYKYKGSEHYSVGFLSQEVQTFSPESVNAPKNQYMAVNYDAVLPYIWEYHKQVYHKNIELSNRLKALEAKFDNIK